MNETLKTTLQIAVLLVPLVFHACESTAEDKRATAVWLARSCVGEAGWGSVDTGECASMMHLYARRGRLNGRGLLWTALKYSAAIKPGVHHRNRWVRHLQGQHEPKHWPARLDWNRYVQRWEKFYWLAHSFMEGEVSDPTPNTMHYGCVFDAHRARPSWRRVKTPPGYRNMWWDVPAERKRLELTAEPTERTR